MYAQLGTIVFESQFSYNEFEQETEARYAEIDLINGKSDLQLTGEELDTITLNVRLHSSFCNPRNRYYQIETHRKNGDILVFVDGKGNLIGNFVIVKNTQTLVQTGNKGEVICSECKLVLREYVSPDRIAARAAAAKEKATALGDVKGLTSVSASVSPSSDVFQSISATQLDARGAAMSVTVPNPSTTDVRAGLSALQRVQQGITDIQAKIDKYETVISVGAQFWTDLTATAEALASSASAMTTTLLNGDLANFKTAADTLLGISSQLPIDALPLERFFILRQ